MGGCIKTAEHVSNGESKYYGVEKIKTELSPASVRKSFDACSFLILVNIVYETNVFSGIYMKFIRK